MDIRTVILKTADYLEQHPTEFSFMATDKPDCGMPGCALGWMSHFAGCTGRSFQGVLKFMDLEAEPQRFRTKIYNPGELEKSYTFYNRLEDLVPDWRWCGASAAPKVVKALRLYADKYHPAIVTTPDWEALAKPAGKTFEPSCAST